jgi:hypothetical protein
MCTAIDRLKELERERGGQRKDEDEHTGGLARLAGRLTGAHVLYVRRRLDYDPNQDRQCAFKRRMVKAADSHSNALGGVHSTQGIKT